MTSDHSGDQDVDLLVVGAGAGGMATALVAALEGLSVLVCEKSDQVGGTAATSAGTIWVPGSTQARRAGHTDTLEAARRYLDREMTAEGQLDAQAATKLRAYLETGAEALDYLEARSDVKFIAPAKHPDYHAWPGAVLAGRALIPPVFDGRKLGRDFALVRAPIPEFMVLGGMMIGKDDIPPLLAPFASLRALKHVIGLVLRQVSDRLRYARGTRLVMGNAFVARLFYSLKQRGVPIRFGSPVTELLRDGDRVVGAVAGGQRIQARRGVVRAAGGFGASAAWRARLLPQPTAPHTPMYEGVT
ncbi:MAG: FAD-dependent oxidoreductase, partial [Alphaproteobacteria bacterium]|nr:FAD-dependent oxidoreductase [Alphaproteobacteria bacterium]